MKPYKLYGRAIRGGPLRLESHHTTFKSAVHKGQNKFGSAMFHVGHIHGLHDFTRDEQLLRETREDLLNSI